MSFNISYSFKAIDKFSGVAARIKKSVKDISAKVEPLQNRLKSAGRDLRNLSLKMAAFATTSIGLIGMSITKAAIDAEEQSSKFGEVFRNISTDANNAALELSRSFGLSRVEAKKFLGDTGDLLTGFGFGQKAALDMSLAVNKLGADLASFTNVQGGTTRASAAITRALLGEREMLKSLGKTVLESDVKARVKQLVLVEKMRFETLRQAKAFATLQLITEQAKNSIGDYSRTKNSAANVTKRLGSTLLDLKVTLGKILLPTYIKIVLQIMKFSRVIEDSSPAVKKFILVLGGLLFVAAPLLAIVGFLAIGLAALISPITAIVAGVTLAIGVVAALIYRFDGLKRMIVAVGSILKSVFIIILTPARVMIEVLGKILYYFAKLLGFGVSIGDMFSEWGLDKIASLWESIASNIEKVAKYAGSISLFGGNEDDVKKIIGRQSFPIEQGLAALNLTNQTRIDGTIDINAPQGVVKSFATKTKGASGNLGLNLRGVGG